MPSLAITLGDSELSSPLIAASGTVGSVLDFNDTIDFSLYGAAVAKSVAPEPWPGRIPPRIAPADSGMLNGIGIQNPGIAAWLDEYDEELDLVPTKVWGSAVGHDIDGFVAVAAEFDASNVSAVEVNLSCPNLDGVPFALDSQRSAEVIRAVREATRKPIGAKLSADALSVSVVAEAVIAAGADWVVMGNTVMGARIDVATRRPFLSGVIGGYSGGPIRPISLRCVLEIRRNLPDISIVGCGGVSTADHVIEYLLAGANAVGIGSAHFATPRCAKGITSGLRSYMQKHDVTELSELVGAYEPWQ